MGQFNQTGLAPSFSVSFSSSFAHISLLFFASKQWAPDRPQSLQTYTEHTGCVYSTFWSPRNPDVFASVSADRLLKIWDAKSPRSVQTIKAHDHDILAMDWNKYQEDVIVTGSADRSMKVWDLRFPGRELNVLLGHTQGIRKLKCSPHMGNVVASASYDLTTRVWDLDRMDPLVFTYNHPEFVAGVDFNLYVEGQIASCSWDSVTHIFRVPQLSR